VQEADELQEEAEEDQCQGRELEEPRTSDEGVAPDEERADKEEDKEADKEEDESFNNRTLPSLRGEPAPRLEPACCTERWPPLTLAPITGGTVAESKAAKDRNAKQKLVAELLCRWWYVLPDWPPRNFDYDAALALRGYRKVAVETLEDEPEIEGKKKVFAISGGYRGVYRDEQGCLVDVRPVEGRPSYDQLMLRTVPELHKLVVAAFTRQLEELESRPSTGAVDMDFRADLRRQVAQAKQRAVFALSFMPKSK